MSDSLDPRLLEAFKEFDAFCRSNGIRYVVSEDGYDYQKYLVKFPWAKDHTVVEQHMNNALSKMVVMDVASQPEGALFTFGVKVFGEDQYKSPTRKMIRKQSPFRSSFGPSKSFGGVRGYGKLNKKLSEALGLKDDLLAHDNVTVIPSGSEVGVHDPDPELPDLDYGGTVVNVDKDKLGGAINKKSEKEFKATFNEAVLSEQTSSLGAILTSRIHEGYTVAADRAFAAGFLTQDERIALSDAITAALNEFTSVMKEKFPNIYRREVDGKEAMGMSGTFRERIERRISKL